MEEIGDGKTQQDELQSFISHIRKLLLIYKGDTDETVNSLGRLIIKECIYHWQPILENRVGANDLIDIIYHSFPGSPKSSSVPKYTFEELSFLLGLLQVNKDCLETVILFKNRVKIEIPSQSFRIS